MKRPISRFRQWLQVLFLSTLLLTIIACSSSDHHSKFLRLGTNVWLGYEPLYLAQELGYFQNKQIHLTEYASTTQVLRAYRNNAIDAAALTLDEVLQLVNQGYSPRIVLVTDISNGADAIIGTSDIDQFKDLKEKTIGVENSALGAFFISRALTKNDMKMEQVKLVPLEINEQEKAFDNKQVDAVVTFEPVRSQLLEKGAKSLFDSSMIAGEIVDVLVVRDTFLKSRPEQINHLIDGWFRARDYLQNNRVRASGIMAKRLKLNPEAIEEALRLIKIPDQDENYILVANHGNAKLSMTVTRLASMMRDQGLIENMVGIEDLFDWNEL